MKNHLSTAILVSSLLCLGGCTKNEPDTPTAGMTPPAPAKTAAGPSTPSTPSSSGPATPAAVSSSGLHGVVAERIDVPSYTYLRITGPQGETWAAVPSNPVKVGAEVTVVNPMPMQNFKSSALKRTFDTIMFGTSVQVAGGETPAAANETAAATPGAPQTPAMVPNPHVGNGATSVTPDADMDKIKVAKATGSDGHTVAEVYDQSKALKDKTVKVRAKVVKVTPGVLGRNWLHVRDGSGSDSSKNNDLVVTTTQDAQVNDEITITGVVHTDKDLGSGYVYSVLVEDAKISK